MSSNQTIAAFAGKLNELAFIFSSGYLLIGIILITNVVFDVVFFHSRYLTVLYFLNDVEEGGETAFPVANNETFDEDVSFYYSSA